MNNKNATFIHIYEYEFTVVGLNALYTIDNFIVLFICIVNIKRDLPQ